MKNCARKVYMARQLHRRYRARDVTFKPQPRAIDSSTGYYVQTARTAMVVESADNLEDENIRLCMT